MAQGSAGVALPGDIWSAMRNPALLNLMPSCGSVSWTPARYGFSELGGAGIALLHRIGAVGAGFGLTHLGGVLYREITPSVGAAIDVGEGVSLGLRAGLLCVAIDRYGSTSVPVVDAGSVFSVHRSLSVGVCATNLTRASIHGVIDDRLPSGLRLGARWSPDSSVAVQMEFDKDIRWPVTTRAGIEYVPVRSLALRVGATMQPWTMSSGFGLVYGGLAFDYAFRWHPDLDGTHMFSIGFQP